MSPKSQTTLVCGKKVRLVIRRSRRARRTTVHVDHGEGLVVVLPQRAPLREVEQMLAEHAAWIDRQVDKYGVRDGPVRREFVTGSEFLFLGIPRRLVIELAPATARRSRVAEGDSRLELKLVPEDALHPRRVLERWLRRRAGTILRERVDEMAVRIGLRPAKVIVGERKSRWGSCSGQGTLSFCFRLVMAPPPVIDGVVAHEICHLRHLNHGRRFWRLLRLACPDYEEQMAWLKEHEGELTL